MSSASVNLRDGRKESPVLAGRRHICERDTRSRVVHTPAFGEPINFLRTQLVLGGKTLVLEGVGKK